MNSSLTGVMPSVKSVPFERYALDATARAFAFVVQLGTETICYAICCQMLQNTLHARSRSIGGLCLFFHRSQLLHTFVCDVHTQRHREKKTSIICLFFSHWDWLFVWHYMSVTSVHKTVKQIWCSYVPLATFHNTVDDLVVFACVCVAKQLGILCQSSARVLKWRRSSPRYCMHSRIGIDYNGPEAPRRHDLLSFCAAHAPRLRFATTRSNKHTHARDYGSPIRQQTTFTRAHTRERVDNSSDAMRVSTHNTCATYTG